MVLDKVFPFPAECTSWYSSTKKNLSLTEGLVWPVDLLLGLNSLLPPKPQDVSFFCAAGQRSPASPVLPHWTGQVPAENSLQPERGPNYCHGDSQLLLSTSLGSGHKGRVLTLGHPALLEACGEGTEQAPLGSPGGLWWVCFLREKPGSLKGLNVSVSTPWNQTL